jgi:predicted HTH domain antitoxin
MQVTLTIPDELAAELIAAGREPARAALEALAIEGYRSQRLSEAEVKRMLGYGTRMQVHALLAEHGVDLNYTVEHAQQEIAASNRFLEDRAAQTAQSR